MLNAPIKFIFSYAIDTVYCEWWWWCGGVVVVVDIKEYLSLLLTLNIDKTWFVLFTMRADHLLRRLSKFKTKFD